MLGAEAHTGSLSGDAEAPPPVGKSPRSLPMFAPSFPSPRSSPAFPFPPLYRPARSSPSSQSLQAITPSRVAPSPFKSWWLQRVGGILGTHTAGDATHRAHGRALRCASVARNGEFLLRGILTLHVELSNSWPYGLMDKALVFGTKDSRLES